MTDPQLLGLSLSLPQETLLRAIYGLPLTADQLEIFRACTGRERYRPGHAFAEATVIVGARGGKDSRIAVPVALYEAVFGQHDARLSRGELGMIPLVAQDTRATQVAFNYAVTYMTHSPLLRDRVADEPKAQRLELVNGLMIACFPSTVSGLRAWSIPAAVLDELAFFRLEGSVESDVEIQASIRRGMLSFIDTRLVKISTPYMKGGVLFEDFKRGFGQDDPDLLVWRASSRLMNPSITEARLERERRLDPQRFAREYEGEFAEDLQTFLPGPWVEAAIQPGCFERPPHPRNSYAAGLDPSGGGADAFALSIGHAEGSGVERRLVQDVSRGHTRIGATSPNLANVVAEYAGLLRAFGLDTVAADRYAGAWVVQAFAAEQIRVTHTEQDASWYLLALEPWFSQTRIDLLDHAPLARELRTLERRPRAGGRDLVTHPRGGHDDHAVALAIMAHALEDVGDSEAFVLDCLSRGDSPDEDDYWGDDAPSAARIELSRGPRGPYTSKSGF